MPNWPGRRDSLKVEAVPPAWLRQPEITAADIAGFYADREKVASDEFSRNLSLSAKRLALEPSLAWEAYRWVRFAGAIGRNALASLRPSHGEDPRAARS